jgi:hopanoid biosynthesis associated protein HpnK
MVGGPAARDAIERARRLPSLRVGLHLVLVDGAPVLPAGRIPDLVDARGRLRSDLVTAGVGMFLRPRVRRQLAAEIDAQFAAFRESGLALDHVNAHHHYQLHPTVCDCIVEVGARYGMRALRVPIEPGRFQAPWVTRLRNRVRISGLFSADSVFGLAWSGHMTEARFASILQHLPDGLTEIYCHPATADDFIGAAPGYRYKDELSALTSQGVRSLVESMRVRRGGFRDFAGERPPA